jgi:hypothetical protein
MLRGRVAKGALAGLIASLVPLVINYSARHMGWSELVWADFAAAFALGRRATSILEHVYTMGVVFWWLLLLGVVFALLLARLPHENHLLVGWLYSTLIWFASYTMGVVLHSPQIGPIGLGTALTHLASATSWGIALPLVLNWLYARCAT